MKTWTIASTLVALSLGASLTACGGAEISDGSQLPGDEVASGELMSDFEPEYVQIGEEVTSCDDNQYDHWRNLAALAVASANELGRWNTAKDFVKSGTGIALSSEGLARCTNGCENIKAILELQNDVSKIIPRHDPALLRQYMGTFLDRQITWSKNNPVPDHTLKLAAVSNDVCGFRYHFDVVGAGSTTTTTTSSGSSNTWGGTTALVPTHSWKCVNAQNNSTADNVTAVQDNCAQIPTQVWTMENKGGSNYQFKNGAGKCLGVANNATNDGATVTVQSCNGASGQLFTATHKGSNNFEIKNTSSNKCLDVSSGTSAAGLRMQIYACHGGANQTYNLPTATLGGAATTTTTTTAASSINPSVLFNQLKFAGETENKFLMFQSTATQASIDPMGTMIDGGSKATSGSCLEGATQLDSDNLSGKCCVVSGKYGTLQVSTWNKKLYYCK
jgi:Ricin-type beta-trefoil lectin domain-like